MFCKFELMKQVFDSNLFFYFSQQIIIVDIFSSSQRVIIIDIFGPSQWIVIVDFMVLVDEF